jgi:ketosteroid isomerase-like protein
MLPAGVLSGGRGVDERRSTVTELFELRNAGKHDAVGALFTADGVFDVVHFPANSAMGNPTVGRDAIHKVFAEIVPGLFEGMRFEIVETYLCEDPELVVVEYATRATARPTGKPYSNRYVGIVRVCNGQIAVWREYHNPERMTEAFGSPAGTPGSREA